MPYTLHRLYDAILWNRAWHESCISLRIDKVHTVFGRFHGMFGTAIASGPIQGTSINVSQLSTHMAQ